ncbi:biotin/lipoyl-containing protein [Ornithinimicrobium sp. CNJ-824]|uniref:biotin/lipoyl-containing protein n=1 Tax=Ornithinimicrobium sp. CNJ-824 TaxID=1904966 RepID=UPI0031593D0B
MSGFVFRLPDLGEGLTEAEVVEWHVAVGDEVSIDEEVVTVETAKRRWTCPAPTPARSPSCTPGRARSWPSASP